MNILKEVTSLISNGDKTTDEIGEAIGLPAWSLEATLEMFVEQGKIIRVEDPDKKVTWAALRIR